MLSGVRIVDLSSLLPGPYATRLLAEQGAEVIKVERPGTGDAARQYPPLEGDPPQSLFFSELNRGKKSVTLDLKSKDGIEALHKLLKDADVLVESNRAGVLDRLGLSRKTLCEKYPKLIGLSLSGFAAGSQEQDRPGHDLTFLARAGAIASAAKPAPFQAVDISASYAAVALLSMKLFERTRTGVGGWLEVPLADVAFSLNLVNLVQLAGGEPQSDGEGILEGRRPCYTMYRCQDGASIAVGALEPKFWKSFLEVIGHSEFEPFALAHGQQGKAVRQAIQLRMMTRTGNEWMEAFDRTEACVELVRSAETAVDDEYFQRLIGEDGGTRSILGGRHLGPAPKLGQHNEP